MINGKIVLDLMYYNRNIKNWDGLFSGGNNYNRKYVLAINRVIDALKTTDSDYEYIFITALMNHGKLLYMWLFKYVEKKISLNDMVDIVKILKEGAINGNNIY